MKRLLMMIGAAAIVAMADVALATDLDNYRFRYDFSTGRPVFYGSSAQSTDPILSTTALAWEYTTIAGDTALSGAVHPAMANWGNIGYSTLNADWTLAMQVSPGSTENGVFFSMGRMTSDNCKRIVFCSSSTVGKIKVDVDYTASGTGTHETEIELDVGDTAGFHYFVVVHHASSGNMGTLEFYWDGAQKGSYTTSIAYPFGTSNGQAGIQFCHQISSGRDPAISSYTDSPDAAFKDVRLYMTAFDADGAAQYAALHQTLFHNSSLGVFAKRAQDFNVGDYVQDNLVAHFDGICNAGADEEHSSTATTWANLVPGGAAATKKTIAATSYTVSGARLGEWEENCYVFRGKEFFELGDALALGDAATVQIAADFTASSRKTSWYPNLFGAIDEDGDKFAVNFNENFDAAADRGKIRTKGPWGTEHVSSAAWSASEPYANAIYDIANKRVSVSGGDSYDWQADADAQTIASRKYAIGSGCKTDTSSSYQRGIRALVGRVKSVRVYTDVLSEEELKWNRIVDNARFSGTMDADFVVAESARGLQGVEAPGEYIVNGSHTFTATNLTDGVFTWAPAGCKLERWNASAGTWSIVGYNEGNSFTYVNSKANGKMRLSWIWEQTGAVKGGYEPDDYIQDGLILHFDGIRNAGADAAHDDSATTWANLGSLGSANNATLATLSSGAPSGASAGEWFADGYRLNGQDYFAIPSATLGGAVTVQIAADYTDSEQVTDYPAFFGQKSDSANDNFMIYFNRTGSIKNYPCFKLLAADTHQASAVWSGLFATAVYDKTSVNGVRIGNSVVPAWQKRNASGDVPAYTYAIGTTRNISPRMLVGTMKSVRVYNRVLSDFALTHNRAIDEVRYNGNVTIVNGAIGDTGTTGESSAADGCYEVSSGTWTVTAGPKKVEGVTYQPKLLVEDYLNGAWVARTTKPQWKNSFTADAEALGSGRIRLTWSWQYQRGFIISVY